MVLDGIDPEGLTSYFLDDVYKESSHLVLTIGLPVRTLDDDIGKVHGFEDALKKIPNKDL